MEETFPRRLFPGRHETQHKEGFMLKAFWTWDPVCSGTYRAFDEPYACEHNKWFFDKSVWQKMFRTMSGCDFNAVVLANTHPFPYMMDMGGYPEASVLSSSDLAAYQGMHRWIFQTALDYDIAPYLAFYCIYYPDSLRNEKGIAPEQISTPTDFAAEYTNYCLRTLLENYPDLSGFIVDISGINGDAKTLARFVQQAILDTTDAARPDVTLYLRGFEGAPNELVEQVRRRSRPIHYVAPYTHQHLVGAGGDESYGAWVDAVGPDFLLAEMAPCNFEPWTSFSFDTAEEIVQDLNDTGNHGFLLHPLSEFEWPHTSDMHFKYQWQRDLPWYNVWGGTGLAQMLRQGQPKWMSRNSRLIPGFSSGSRILELLSLYVAGDRGCGWRPQFCAVRNSEDGGLRLLSIQDMLSMSESPVFAAQNWWKEVTGDAAVHLEEYLESGTPEDAYGPDELIEELADLAEQAVAAGEKGMRSASGEKELPSFARDALCMGRLGEFYVERFKAALAHGREDHTEALEHMARALELYREISAVDMSHRDQFRIRTDHSAVDGDWLRTLKALEAEYADALEGRKCSYEL